MTQRATEADLANCAREPIHIPGSIQPHGLLLVLDDGTLGVLQYSDNVPELLGVTAQDVLHKPIAELLGDDFVKTLQSQLSSGDPRPLSQPLKLLAVDGERRGHLVAQRTSAGILVEVEFAEEPPHSQIQLHAVFDKFLLEAESSENLSTLSERTASCVRQITGFDRVLIYQFDEAWNGMVVGEDANGNLPSYLHHRFPASDIPAQARELYRVNRLRMIPSASYRPVPVTPALNPRTGKTLDMTFATLRSVSPVHLEYMRNMETGSSMSVSILRGDKLWGLISCHHRQPKLAPLPIREVCDRIARVFSLRLSALEQTQSLERRVQVRAAYSKLLAAMAKRGEFAAALHEQASDFLDFVQASGGAILTDGGCHLVGQTPSEENVRELAQWLFQSVKQDVYATDALAQQYSAAKAYQDVASGLLAVAVSKLHPSYVLWFRPEVIRTIEWGGNPEKPAEIGSDAARLHPRRSFETWRQQVRERSVPWQASEIEGAGELRNAIVGIVLRKAEELAALNAELTRSNNELEAFAYSVSHDLRAPLRHIVGYAEMLREDLTGSIGATNERYINSIIESSEYTGRLVEKLLGYSRLGRAELQRIPIDMNLVVREVRADVMRDAGDRKITWHIGPLPTIDADLMMIRMAVRDLASNAVKYTRNKEEGVIEIGSRQQAGETVFWVKDNGVGFDMRYADKLFGVFQRLHRWEDYEGTGIGLANVRRVIDRHGGRTWAEAKEGRGATFYFSLPAATAGNGP